MNLPNKITSIRLVLVFLGLGILIFPYHQVIDGPIVAFPLFGTETNAVYLIVGIMFIVASFTDFLDGYLARKLNLVTNLGKFLDPVADKVLTNGALIALMIQPDWIDYPQITIPLWAVLIMVIRDLIIDALRMIAVEQKKVIAANIYGKVKTFFQMITIIMVFFNNPFFSVLPLPIGFSITEMLMYISAALSFISLVVYLKENLHVLHQKTN